MKSLTDHLPSQNLDAERGVLGGILLDNAVLHDVIRFLDPEDFYREAHQTIYRAIVGLYSANQAIDAVTLSEALIQKGQYDLIGGDEILLEICNSVPHAANTKYHAEIVRQKSITRSLVQVGNDLIRDGYSNLFTADQLLEAAEQKIFAVSQARSKDLSHTYTMEQAVGMFHELMLRRQSGEIDGLTTGFPDLDEIIMGLRKKQLIILAARPGSGKTSLAMNIAWHASTVLGKKVLFLSLEMAVEELTERLVSSVAKIDSKRLKDPYYLQNVMSCTEHEKILLAMSEISQSTLKINDCSGQTVMQIASLCRQMKAQEGLDLLVIDYLGKIRPTEGQTTNDKVTHMVGAIKDLTGELGIPILCLHQLNRDCVKEGIRPQMHHLRDSGSIEQDAHGVWLLHSTIPKDQVTGPVELIVEKNRGGATGIINLFYEMPFTLFSSMATQGTY